MPKVGLKHLTEHLFVTIELLTDETIAPEIRRQNAINAQAIANVANAILKTNAQALELAKLANEGVIDYDQAANMINKGGLKLIGN